MLRFILNETVRDGQGLVPMAEAGRPFTLRKAHPHEKPAYWYRCYSVGQIGQWVVSVGWRNDVKPDRGYDRRMREEADLTLLRDVLRTLAYDVCLEGDAPRDVTILEMAADIVNEWQDHLQARDEERAEERYR